MTVAPANPLLTAQPTTPSPAAAFAAAVALRQFTGDVSTARLRDMLRGSGMDSRWLSGPRWALLERLWNQRVGEAAARDAITSFDR